MATRTQPCTPDKLSLDLLIESEGRPLDQSSKVVQVRLLLIQGLDTHLTYLTTGNAGRLRSTFERAGHAQGKPSNSVPLALLE